eukprot:5528021-Pyramimonas_sp.AAC.1
MVKSTNTPHRVRVLVLSRKADGVLGPKGLRFEFQSGLSKGLISSVVQGYGLGWAGASGTIVRVSRFVETLGRQPPTTRCLGVITLGLGQGGSK